MLTEEEIRIARVFDNLITPPVLISMLSLEGVRMLKDMIKFKLRSYQEEPDDEEDRLLMAYYRSFIALLDYEIHEIQS